MPSGLGASQPAPGILLSRQLSGEDRRSGGLRRIVAPTWGRLTLPGGPTHIGGDEEEEMADVDQDLPGTWLVRVTQNGALVSRAIVTYTSDRGFVERIDSNMEGLVGV